MKEAIAVTVGAVLACMLFAATVSADVTITIPTTAQQDVKLVKLLASLNEERAALPAAPYASLEEALTDIVKRDVRRRIRILDIKEHGNIYTAWEAADEATKDQIRVLLGVQ